VLAHYRSKPDHQPVVLSVEAVGAACVLKSLQTGEITSVQTVPTIMAGMNCGTPSSDSWQTHKAGVDAAVALTDEEARLDLKVLADYGVDAGPCGAATLSGVRKALSTQERRDELGITQDSVIVLVSTEGRAANPMQ
jgi:diaminopropionate ammonia-lyase